MAIGGINSVLLYYKKQKVSLMGNIQKINDRMLLASVNTNELMTKINSQRSYYSDMALQNPAITQTAEYNMLVQSVENDYQSQLGWIQNWEANLDSQKANDEAQLASIQVAEESWTKMLSNNIKKDMAYFSSASS